MAVQAKEVQASAQLHALHLVAVMVKLRPDWLPEPLFQLLHARWLSPERQIRCSWTQIGFRPPEATVQRV